MALTWPCWTFDVKPAFGCIQRRARVPAATEWTSSGPRWGCRTMVHVTRLADSVLPLIRTRSDLSRWGAANAHGRQMHEAVDMLEAALPATEPGEAYAVSTKALASAIKVIARADDSSGIIGDACRRLLALHPQTATAAAVPPARLAAWMVKFQFDGDVDYFEIDPVAYSPALGASGLAAYRARLNDIEAGLGPTPAVGDRWNSPHAHEWFVLEWNARRLAVLDRDHEAIVRTHARDRKVAAWLEDTARAFSEIGEADLAIHWAKQATDFDQGHQARRASDYWCALLAEHRPIELVGARLTLFRRWPSASTATHLHRALGAAWTGYRDEVEATLRTHPREAVLFALLTLDDVAYAWHLAHTLDLADNDLWERLANRYETTDPAAVIPVLARLVDQELTEAGAQHYRAAARRLARMRKLAANLPQAAEIDQYVTQLRDLHRRRPRLQQEFDRAGLP